MMTRISVAAMAACALLLGACASKPAKQTPVLVQTPPRVVVVMDPQLAELLAYQNALRLMTPSELAKAQLDLAKADTAPQNVIRRAMLHASVRAPGMRARCSSVRGLSAATTSSAAKGMAPITA